MIWAYKILAQFKQARIGNKIISFEDLVKERNIENQDEELHCWIARKDKRDYLLLNDYLKELPIKIKETQVFKEKASIYHFICKFAPIGFKAEKCMDFRQLVDTFFDVQHSNKEHFKLFKILAMASYISRINVRICSNPEFGKDSTFEVLNYLTNQVAVFDKPRTMAKLEYGVVNSVLMVNELVPKSEEEKRNIQEFLLSVGSLKPIYEKTSRGSSSFGTQDNYDINNLSLIICYNSLNDVSEKDQENYFDYIFGNNVKTRYIPFKFSGKLDVEQFMKTPQYNLEIDGRLTKVARTIQYYKNGFERDLKPYSVDFSTLKLEGREKNTLQNIVKFINLYAEDEQEFQELVSKLLECHYAYKRMLSNSQLINTYSPEQRPRFNNTKEEELVVKEESIVDEEQGAMQYMKENKEVSVDDFLDKYSEAELERLLQKGDVFRTKDKIRVLE